MLPWWEVGNDISPSTHGRGFWQQLVAETAIRAPLVSICQEVTRRGQSVPMSGASDRDACCTRHAAASHAAADSPAHRERARPNPRPCVEPHGSESRPARSPGWPATREPHPHSGVRRPT